MKLYKVNDLKFEEICKGHYHYGIFASGFERRCTYVAKNLKKEKINVTIIFGFKELAENEDRKRNDDYYKNNWTDNIIPLSSNDYKEIYNVLKENIKEQDDTIRIIVDYSSMSRIWYAAILNWLKFAKPSTTVIIDFVYSVGIYKETNLSFVIEDMLCIPGFDGIPIPLNRSIAIFGLGFDRFGPLCVLDHLEPDEIFTYLASPAATSDYQRISEENNKELIEESKRAPLKLPLKSVERTFSILSEVVNPYLNKADITLIPMGPKPHILAAILLSMRFDRFISCMRVSHILKEPQDIDTTGDLVATRVILK